MPGSKAVGHGRNDGTVGVVSAVVTAEVFISAVDDIVCAAKELTGSSACDADFSAGCGSASTVHLDGVDLGLDLGSSGVETLASALGLGFFVGVRGLFVFLLVRRRRTRLGAAGAYDNTGRGLRGR